MLTVSIRLDSVDKVKEFNGIVISAPFEMDLTSGRYVIDAKSVMGIFSLDLSKPITMHVHADKEEADKILKQLDKFIVK